MTKQELLDLMVSDPKADVFFSFRLLPDDLKTVDVAERVMDHCLIHGLPNPFPHIKSCSPELINDPIRFLAVSFERGLGFIRPEETDLYAEIAVHAISKCAVSFEYLDKRFRTKEVANDIFEKCPECVDPHSAHQKWLRKFFTHEITNKVAKVNLRFATSVDFEIPSDQWNELFTKGILDYNWIKINKKTDLLVEFVRDGGWPNPGRVGKRTISFDRVETISEALDGYLRGGDFNLGRIVFEAKILTFQAEDVIKVADSHERVKALVQIYPESTLRSHMNHNRALRAHLLENDLGM